jgi:hypothetical protein
VRTRIWPSALKSSWEIGHRCINLLEAFRGRPVPEALIADPQPALDEHGLRLSRCAKERIFSLVNVIAHPMALNATGILGPATIGALALGGVSAAYATVGGNQAIAFVCGRTMSTHLLMAAASRTELPPNFETMLSLTSYDLP